MSYTQINRELKRRYAKNYNSMVVIISDWPLIKLQIEDLYKKFLNISKDKDKICFIANILEPAIRRYEDVTFGVMSNMGWDDAYRLAIFIETLLSGLVQEHQFLNLPAKIDKTDDEELRLYIYNNLINPTIRNILRKADYDEAVVDDYLAIDG